MSAVDIPSFDELVDELRIRLDRADGLNDEFHSFKTLMADYAEVIADRWYWDAFEELEAQSHLHPDSHKVSGGDARARLSADGRLYLRSQSESS